MDEVSAALVGALIGALAAIVGGFIQARHAFELEKEREYLKERIHWEQLNRTA